MPRPPRTPAPPKRARKRAGPSPGPSTESVEIRMADGVSLRAVVDHPAGEPVGVAVLAHAMMARRTEFERPAGRGVRELLRGHGWRVIAFDFRAHGQSGPLVREGAKYGYDDLVRQDLPALHAYARGRERRRRRVVLVGHSLGAHVGLAAQGLGLVAFDAIVSVAGGVWLRELEPSAARWLVKRAALAAMLATTTRLGRFPARALRLGSDDEALPYVADLARFATTGRWGSADGAADYLAGLARVRAPVLQVVSDGDRLACVPACGALFLDRCGGARELLRIGAADDGGPAPDHMGLVTGGRVDSAWDRVEAWMRGEGLRF